MIDVWEKTKLNLIGLTNFISTVIGRLFRKRGVGIAECGVRSAECGVRSLKKKFKKEKNKGI